MIGTLRRLCELNNIKRNTKFQLFGVDVIFDKNFEPYILEFNKGPDMNAKSKIDKEFKVNLLQDVFYLLNIAEKEKLKENSFYKII